MTGTSPVVLVTSRSFSSGDVDARGQLEAVGARVVTGTPDHDLDTLRPMLSTAVAWIAGTGPVTAAHLDAAPQLRLVARYGVGVDAVDLAAAARHDVVVTNTPGANSGAVADHAGVPRSTVYRHFEDEAALIVACATHWQMANQPPPLEPWAAIEDPDQRLTRALREIYAYYRSAGTMMENVLRDEAAVPVLSEVLGRFRGYLAAAHEILMSDRPSRGSAHRKTRAAIGHALAYTTWQSLARHNQLTDTEAADLMAKLAAAVDIANTGIRTRSEKQAGR